MDIKVTNCNNCPFQVADYDLDACGFDMLIKCGLKDFLKIENYEPIAVYNSWEDQPGIPLCTYCEWYDSLPVDEYFSTPFDESKCTCKQLEEQYLLDHPVEEFKTPEWCPLTEQIIITRTC